MSRPAGRTRSPRSSASSAASPFGARLNPPPAPSARAGWASYTTASMPAFCSAMAVTGPAIPPPMISAVRVISVSLRVLAGVGVAAFDGLVDLVGLAQPGQGGERVELGRAAAPDDHPA